MTPRAWTSDERATLRRMAGQGYTDGEIARHLGRDRRTVCDVRRAMGLQRGCPAVVVAMMARINARRIRCAA